MNEASLEFTIFCIESIAERLNVEPKKIYNLLSKESNIINEYIVNDLIEIMEIRGVL